MRAIAYVIALSSLVSSLVGCASDADIEDGEHDEFLDADAKADAFGVEDWSPDGAAVLRFVSTASHADLDDAVGLSARAAKGIVDQRQAIGGTYTDLAELDAAKYVGRAVFTRLLRHVTDQRLFKTSVRVPLLVDDGYGNTSSLTKYNTLARAYNMTSFARYTFVDDGTPYSAKMGSYDERLQQLAAAAHVTIEDTMFVEADSLSRFVEGSQAPCYIGDPEEVAGVSEQQYGNLMGDMYSIWGWRYQTTKEITSGDETQFDDQWHDWDATSEDVLIISSADDDGDFWEYSTVSPCR